MANTLITIVVEPYPNQWWFLRESDELQGDHYIKRCTGYGPFDSLKQVRRQLREYWPFIKTVDVLPIAKLDPRWTPDDWAAFRWMMAVNAHGPYPNVEPIKPATIDVMDMLVTCECGHVIDIDIFAYLQEISVEEPVQCRGCLKWVDVATAFQEAIAR